MARRPLTREERTLWRFVTRGVEPLSGVADGEAPAPPPPPPELPAPPPVLARATSMKPRAPPPPPPLAPIEARLMRRLRRGAHDVEAVLDLHGMRQAEAHAALRGFLRSMQARGTTLVVVVTGKGGALGPAPYDGGDERGVLRRVVPHWLSGPELRSLVVGFEAAGPRHGGGGALYVRLRRAGAQPHS